MHGCSYVALGYVFGFAASILFSGHYRAVLDSKKPKLFVQGDRDEFTSTSQLQEVCTSARRSLSSLLRHALTPACAQWAVPQSKSAVTETRILPGVSHFQARTCDISARLFVAAFCG